MVAERAGRHAWPMTTENRETEMETGTQPVRRLIRRTDDKVFAGVAGGLGDYFRVDPVWFRLGFVLTTMIMGFGIIAYVVLWVIMPERVGAAPSVPERGLERVAHTLRSTPGWIGAALVALGVILVINAALDWYPGIIWGVSLIALGVLLFVQRDEPRTVADGPSVGLPVPPPAPLTETSVLEPPAGGIAPPLPPTPGGAVPPPPPRVRERSTLGLMTFGVLLVAIGVVTLLDVQNAITFEPVQYLAMALGIIGVGLLVGSVFGRARWLIVPGLALLPFVFVASLVHVPWEGGFGERNYRPVGVGSTANEYRLIAGAMTIDLRGLDAAGFHDIVATTAMGRIQILVPLDATVLIHAKAGAGQLNLFGLTNEGVNVELERVFTGGVEVPQATDATITIEAEVGLGQVEVIRAEA